MLEITGSPGHQRAAITIYDPWSGFLLTGDTVLPGRLYVEDFPLFLASLDGMVKLAGSRTVTHVLGCHVEMTSQPGRDYPIGATYQPGERAPEMTTSQLTAVRDAAASVARPTEESIPSTTSSSTTNPADATCTSWSHAAWRTGSEPFSHGTRARSAALARSTRSTVTDEREPGPFGIGLAVWPHRRPQGHL